jgi:hypothetical protein
MLAEVGAALSELLRNPIGGPVVGFLLSALFFFYLQKRKINSHWYAIRAEMTLCIEKTIAVKTHGVYSPLYRFPVVAVHTAFPILLAEGVLNEEEALAISRYTSLVEDINRGLDIAAQYVGENTRRLPAEYARITMKIDNLMVGKDGNQSVLDAAKAVVDGKILSWRELL